RGSGAGALRRRARRRRLRAEALRRCRDRAPDPSRRRRRPLPGLLLDRFPRPGGRRRLPRGRGPADPRGENLPRDALRGAEGHIPGTWIRGPRARASVDRCPRDRHLRRAPRQAEGPRMSDELLITVAGVGAEVTREQQPKLPLLPDEVGAEYARAYDAGATIGHIHGRRPDGSPTQDRGTMRAYSGAIGARCPIVQQFSTGGAVGMSVEERIEALDLRPEMATLTLGTCNFGEEVFENSLPTIRAILERITAFGIVPELEIFDAGMLATADVLFAKGLLAVPSHFDFVLGVPGAAAATPENLVHFARSIPSGCTWSGAGIGRHQTRMAALALAMGGHVRVGFEDNVWYRKGELATSNAQLVERVVRIAREVGREPATVEETRAMLGLVPLGAKPTALS